MTASAKTASIVAAILLGAAATAVATARAPECRAAVESAKVGAVAAGVALRTESGHEPSGAPMDARAPADDEDYPEGGDALLAAPALPSVRPSVAVVASRHVRGAEPRPLPRLALAPKTSPPAHRSC